MENDKVNSPNKTKLSESNTSAESSNSSDEESGESVKSGLPPKKRARHCAAEDQTLFVYVEIPCLKNFPDEYISAALEKIPPSTEDLFDSSSLCSYIQKIGGADKLVFRQSSSKGSSILNSYPEDNQGDPSSSGGHRGMVPAYNQTKEKTFRSRGSQRKGKPNQSNKNKNKCGRQKPKQTKDKPTHFCSPPKYRTVAYDLETFQGGCLSQYRLTWQQLGAPKEICPKNILEGIPIQFILKPPLVYPSDPVISNFATKGSFQITQEINQMIKNQGLSTLQPFSSTFFSLGQRLDGKNGFKPSLLSSANSPTASQISEGELQRQTLPDDMSTLWPICSTRNFRFSHQLERTPQKPQDPLCGVLGRFPTGKRARKSYEQLKQQCTTRTQRQLVPQTSSVPNGETKLCLFRRPERKASLSDAAIPQPTVAEIQTPQEIHDSRTSPSRNELVGNDGFHFNTSSYESHHTSTFYRRIRSRMGSTTWADNFIRSVDDGITKLVCQLQRNICSLSSSSTRAATSEERPRTPSDRQSYCRGLHKQGGRHEVQETFKTDKIVVGPARLSKRKFDGLVLPRAIQYRS
ncbi:hypothetical protein ACJJTC_019472 [Scirpophaga incertulas]